MKKILASAAAVILMTGAAPGLAKQDKNEPILVDAVTPTMQWASDVSQDLDRELLRIRPSARDGMPNGLVQVRFEVRDGKAVNTRLFHRSGDSWLDRQAVRSIERLEGIPDVPSAAGDSRTVQANIITARDDNAYRVLNARLVDMEEIRMASSGPDRTVIALTAGALPAG